MSDDILIVKIDGKKQSGRKVSAFCIIVYTLSVTMLLTALFFTCVDRGWLAPPSPDCCFLDLNFDF